MCRDHQNKNQLTNSLTTLLYFLSTNEEKLLLMPKERPYTNRKCKVVFVFFRPISVTVTTLLEILPLSDEPFTSEDDICDFNSYCNVFLLS